MFQSAGSCDWCFSRNYPKHVYCLKYAVLQAPCMVISGVLYALVIAQLRKGSKKNSRKQTLTYAFLVLWSCWVLLSLPYTVFETYKTFFWRFQYNFDTDSGFHLALEFHQSNYLPNLQKVYTSAQCKKIKNDYFGNVLQTSLPGTCFQIVNKSVKIKKFEGKLKVLDAVAAEEYFFL